MEMKSFRLLAVGAALGLALLSGSSALAKGGPVKPPTDGPPTCVVTPATVSVGEMFVVDCKNITRKQARYNWFMFRDFGPTTLQGASTYNCGPNCGDVIGTSYGDNGSWAWYDTRAGTAQAHFRAWDPGVHRIELAYTKVFASVSFEVY